jgi:adenosylmethionine-8-amino-7-oxononanoate aminotransferase
VLFIADEVITGFGRTGHLFALERWGVQPDIMAFAKGVTSAYVPLGGIMLSDEIAGVLRSLPPDQAWMHAYTYSGHPTCCAVALRNLEILEQEGLVARADEMGRRLLAGLRGLLSLPAVGEVRGLGLMAAVELVADRDTRASFPASAKVGARVLRIAMERGLLTRVRGDVVMVAPPLVVTEEQVDRIVSVLGDAIQVATAG